MFHRSAEADAASGGATHRDVSNGEGGGDCEPAGASGRQIAAVVGVGLFVFIVCSWAMTDSNSSAHAVAGWAFAGATVFAIGWLIFALQHDPEWLAEQAEKKRAKAERDAKLFCPHCQQFGHVTTEPTTVKRGISGGKATAALLTGGISMLATGLSQEDMMTRATCSNCGSTWLF